MFRRRIVARAGAGQVRAGLEDDMHCFEVILDHGQGRVTSVSARGLRTPWTTCESARDRLNELVGTSISTAVYRRKDLPDPSQQCTHMYDLALVAIAQAARGGTRQYDVTCPDPRGGRMTTAFAPGQTTPSYSDTTLQAHLSRDGIPTLQIEVRQGVILGPEPLTGLALRQLPRWAIERGDDDLLEAVRILRTGLLISYSRDVEIDLFKSPEEMPVQFGVCYTFQPAQRVNARRNLNTKVDFSAHPEALLPDFTA